MSKCPSSDMFCCLVGLVQIVFAIIVNCCAVSYSLSLTQKLGDSERTLLVFVDKLLREEEETSDCSLSISYDKPTWYLRRVITNTADIYRNTRIISSQKQPINALDIKFTEEHYVPVWNCSESEKAEGIHISANGRSGHCEVYLFLGEIRGGNMISNHYDLRPDSQYFVFYPNIKPVITFPAFRRGRYKVVLEEDNSLVTSCDWCKDGENVFFPVGRVEEQEIQKHQDRIFLDFAGQLNDTYRIIYLLFGWQDITSGRPTNENNTVRINFQHLYIDTIAKKFGFDYKLYEGAIMYFIRKENGTSDKCTGYAGSLNYYDNLLFVFQVPHPELYESLTLTNGLYPYYFDSFSFYTRHPTIAAFNFMAFTKPYGKFLWLCLSVTFFVVAGVMSILSFHYNRIVHSHRVYTFLDACLILVKLTFQQGSMKHSGITLRALAVSVSLVLIVVDAGYQGKLASFLTIPSLMPIPTTFKELNASGYTWIVYDEGFEEMGVKLPDLKTYVDTLRRKKIRRTQAHECLRVEPNEACIGWDYESTAWAAMKYVNEEGMFILERSTEQILRTGLAAAVVKGSPHRTLLDRTILQILESGLDLTWWNYMVRNFTGRGKESFRNESVTDRWYQVANEERTMTIDKGHLELKTFLRVNYLMLFGCLVSFVVLCFELFIYWGSCAGVNNDFAMRNFDLKDEEELFGPKSSTKRGNFKNLLLLYDSKTVK